jgi:hypothetical protein
MIFQTIIHKLSQRFHVFWYSHDVDATECHATHGIINWHDAQYKKKHCFSVRFQCHNYNCLVQIIVEQLVCPRLIEDTLWEQEKGCPQWFE